MPKIRTFYSALVAFLPVAMVSAWPMSALAQLELSIKKGDVEGRFVVDGDVTYDLSTGIVGFSVLGGEQTQGSDNPLFCFDFSDQAHTVQLKINANSSVATNGTRVLADQLGLTSALQYQLAAQTIAITPSSDVACFFKAFNTETQVLEKTFGLYGAAPTAATSPQQGVIFQDNFSANPELDVRFVGDGSVDGNGHVSYRILLSNNSNFPVSSIALQQSVPYGLNVSVTACKVDSQDSAICDTAGQDVLRFVDFTLAAGATLDISVTASRNAGWPGAAGSLPIHVAAATPTLGRVVFDVAEDTVAPTSQ